MLGNVFFVAYLATIPLANWLIGHVGTVCVPGGPCLIPVWPGIYAPSGLMVAALALVLRDLVQLTKGLTFSLLAIMTGCYVSAMFIDGRLAAASALAFIMSEFLDAFVYTYLQRRGLTLAVFVSGFIGLVADSLVFLYFAFGSFEHLTGQIIGKTWTVLIACALIHLSRRTLYNVAAR